VVKLQCSNCGQEIERSERQLRQNKTGLFYCSRRCHYAHVRGSACEEHLCPVCGKSYVVGGVGNPPKTQVACSDECQRRSRYRHGARAEAMSVSDAAYLAGILDGEGTVMLYMRRDAVAMRIMVSNTVQQLLTWIAETTGVGTVGNQYPAGRKNNFGASNAKATYAWGCNSEAAETVLTQIRPYLIVKAAQADLAIETQRRLRVPALKADRSWQSEYRGRMQMLNHRGI